jgi:STE24 endopeptidase
LAKSRFNQWAMSWETGVVMGVLFSGLLPWSAGWLEQGLGSSVWTQAAWVCLVGLLLGLTLLPLAWYAQFHLEARFGFNTASRRLWWTDLGKSLVLWLGLGYPLVGLLLWAAECTGPSWWLWAWASAVGWQLLVLWLAPRLILPWFNKFTPLQPGPLRDRLLALAQRTGFPVASIQVMDGSRRTRHSNAFLVGLGRWRKVVLWDTLLEQFTETELEAVLAHEIGHYRLRHTLKALASVAVGLLLALAALSWLARQRWFYRAFGFDPGSLAPALVLALLLSNAVGFWLLSLVHGLSRRFEFQADAFAVQVIGSARPLIAALRRLSEKNLVNLTPHPLYSRIYDSHPTLLEREQALSSAAPGTNAAT